jgi:hypothetical protein
MKTKRLNWAEQHEPARELFLHRDATHLYKIAVHVQADDRP